MAVNKGEIGIYGVLRRDGGDGILAKTDQIKDTQLNKTQEQLNQETVKHSEMGVVNGVATLDSTGVIPYNQFPAIADDEDLIEVNNRLKLKDKVYDPDNFSGKGYVILRKNIVEDKNILTQDMINKPNTVYEIRYDFDLNSAEITLPKNCALRFIGGSINNGTINGNSCIIYNLYRGNCIYKNCNIIPIYSKFLKDFNASEILPKGLKVNTTGVNKENEFSLTTFIVSDSDEFTVTIGVNSFKQIDIITNNRYINITHLGLENDMSNKVQNILNTLNNNDCITFYFPTGRYIIHDLYISKSCYINLCGDNTRLGIDNSIIVTDYRNTANNRNFISFTGEAGSVIIGLKGISIFSVPSPSVINEYQGICFDGGKAAEFNFDIYIAQISGFKYAIKSNNYSSNTKIYHFIISWCTWGIYFTKATHTLYIEDVQLNNVAYGITNPTGHYCYIKNIHQAIGYYGNDFESLLAKYGNFYCIKTTKGSVYIEGYYGEEYSTGHHAEKFTLFQIFTNGQMGTGVSKTVIANSVLPKPSGKGGYCLGVYGANNYRSYPNSVFLNDCNIDFSCIDLKLNDTSYKGAAQGVIINHSPCYYDKINNIYFCNYPPVIFQGSLNIDNRYLVWDNTSCIKNKEILDNMHFNNTVSEFYITHSIPSGTYPAGVRIGNKNYGFYKISLKLRGVSTKSWENHGLHLEIYPIVGERSIIPVYDVDIQEINGKYKININFEYVFNYREVAQLQFRFDNIDNVDVKNIIGYFDFRQETL